jgi:hypothetical protein
MLVPHTIFERLLNITQHRRLLNIVGYSTSSITQHRQPCPIEIRRLIKKIQDCEASSVTRPHRLLDLTNVRMLSDVCAGYVLRMLSDVFAGYVCVLYRIYVQAIQIRFAGYLLKIN